jgi:thiol-disulfide isomerase/thioredoxin
MRRTFGPAWAALLIGGFLAVPAMAQDEKRTAEAILKDLEQAKMPEIPANRQDQAAIQDYIKKRATTMQKRSELALELYKSYPDHADVAKLMAERWMSMPPIGPQGESVTKEVDEVLADSKNEKLKTEAQFVKAVLAIRKNQGKFDAAMPAINAFIAAAPKDPRAGQLLYSVASSTEDKDKKAAFEDRLIKDFPDSMYANMIKGVRKQREAVGKPFDLPEFKDAISGATVSMTTLKGKVVVVDFWATWCGPCVAEMPNMKKLYAEYKDKGVEFVGVSLDQPEDAGGLKALKEFVAKNEIGWPQYYQGKGWESEFSAGWGVNSIPCVYIIDSQGKLFSTEARGKLEELIPELLKKSTSAGAGGQ